MFGLEDRLNSMLGDPYSGVWIITLIGAFLMAVPMLLIGIEVNIVIRIIVTQLHYITLVEHQSQTD